MRVSPGLRRPGRPAGRGRRAGRSASTSPRTRRRRPRTAVRAAATPGHRGQPLASRAARAACRCPDLTGDVKRATRVMVEAGLPGTGEPVRARHRRVRGAGAAARDRPLRRNALPRPGRRRARRLTTQGLPRRILDRPRARIVPAVVEPPADPDAGTAGGPMRLRQLVGASAAHVARTSRRACPVAAHRAAQDRPWPCWRPSWRRVAALPLAAVWGIGHASVDDYLGPHRVTFASNFSGEIEIDLGPIGNAYLTSPARPIGLTITVGGVGSATGTPGTPLLGSRPWPRTPRSTPSRRKRSPASSSGSSRTPVSTGLDRRRRAAAGLRRLCGCAAGCWPRGWPGR